MSLHQEKFIEIAPYMNFLPPQLIPVHKISYLEFGSYNKQVVICAHGLTRNAHDFDKLASILAKEFRVIAISYPGRGNSDWFVNKNHYNYAVYIRDTIKIFEKLKIKNPFWLGTSMGGIIGMIMAGKFKNIFKGLILNDIGPSMPTATVNKISNYAKQINYFDNLQNAKEYLKLIYSGFGITREEDWDYITNHSFIENDINKYQMNYDSGIVRGIDKTISSKLKNITLWHLWHKINCKLLVIHGAKSNILLPETLIRMQETVLFDLFTIQDAGHAPALVEYEHINFIHNWLKIHK